MWGFLWKIFGTFVGSGFPYCRCWVLGLPRSFFSAADLHGFKLIVLKD